MMERLRDGKPEDLQLAKAADLLRSARPPDPNVERKLRVRIAVLSQLRQPRRIFGLRPALGVTVLLLATAAAASVTFAVVHWVRAPDKPAPVAVGAANGDDGEEDDAQASTGRRQGRRALRSDEVEARAAVPAVEAPPPVLAPTPIVVAPAPAVAPPNPPPSRIPDAPPSRMSAAEARTVAPARDGTVRRSGKRPIAPSRRRVRLAQVEPEAMNDAQESDPAPSAQSRANTAPALTANPAIAPAMEPAREPSPSTPPTPPTRTSAPVVRAPAPIAAPVLVPAPAADAEPEPEPEPDAEVALLQRAFTALRSEGAPARALRLFEVYLRAFPSGKLAEEALGLAIEAAAKTSDARTADLARRYLERYPTGRFLPAANRALRRFGR